MTKEKVIVAIWAGFTHDTADTQYVDFSHPYDLVSKSVGTNWMSNHPILTLTS